MSELKLPALGENIASGTVTKILVKVGDSIKKGQNILELETDKAVLEVPSPEAGTVTEILIKSGAVVKVGQTIFNLGGAASAAATPAAPAAAATSTAAKAAPANTAAVTAPIPASVPGGISEMTLPALGENIEKGSVTKILVKIGDSIKKGQSILELETDKAVLEVPSPSACVIKDILIKSGTVIKVGQAIFKVEGGASAAAPAKPASSAPAASAKTTAAPAQAAAPSIPPVSAAHVHVPVRKDIPAAPSVRLLARELGIDIALVPGTGSGGRISIDDVKAYCKMLNTTRPTGGGVTQQALPNFAKYGNVRREAMNNIRKKTAEHLSYAWNSIPHVTQFDKADITQLEKLRKTSSSNERKLSITPFLIKVIAAALKKFPQFNSAVDMTTNEIVYKDYINIGVAVDTDRGLMVPVLRNVDQKSVEQISDELTQIAEKARARKITLEDLQGGCFTISNLGGIGGTHFTPIVNSPEVAILGVSRGVMEPVYVESNFVPRLMLPLSLSYDHRVIDGADGARFIRFISEEIAKANLSS